MRMKQRIAALEAKGGSGLSHVVVWKPDHSFDDCLANSFKPVNSGSRMLIELKFVGGPDLTPVQLAERDKAYSWADELEAA